MFFVFSGKVEEADEKFEREMEDELEQVGALILTLELSFKANPCMFL